MHTKKCLLVLSEALATTWHPFCRFGPTMKHSGCVWQSHLPFSTFALFWSYFIFWTTHHCSKVLCGPLGLIYSINLMSTTKHREMVASRIGGTNCGINEKGIGCANTQYVYQIIGHPSPPHFVNLQAWDRGESKIQVVFQRRWTLQLNPCWPHFTLDFLHLRVYKNVAKASYYSIAWSLGGLRAWEECQTVYKWKSLRFHTFPDSMKIGGKCHHFCKQL